MTEFTKDDIEHYRKQYALWTSRGRITPEELHLIGRLRDALDEIERQAKRIAELEQERRWVPVSERLPEKSGFYFLHICGSDGKKWERVGLFFVDGQFDIINDKVTHWQYLPQPPNDGE
jgi:hypothetical protein